MMFMVTELVIYSLFHHGIICQSRQSNKKCSLESNDEDA